MLKAFTSSKTTEQTNSPAVEPYQRTAANYQHYSVAEEPTTSTRVSDHAGQAQSQHAGLQRRASIVEQETSQYWPYFTSKSTFQKYNQKKPAGVLKQLGLSKQAKDLGEGSFAHVQHWVTKDGKDLAVKVIKKELYESRDVSLKDGEVDALELDPHPSLIDSKCIILKRKGLSFRKVFKRQNTYAVINSTQPLTASRKQNYHLAAMVYEKASGFTLSDLIYDSDFQFDHPEIVLNSHKVTHIMLKAAEGLLHLYRQGLVHRDIKADNLIYNHTTGDVKITDYGFLKRIGRNRTNSFIGTPFYMAPEVWNTAKFANAHYGYAADAWCLGCVGMDCLTGFSPADYNHAEKRFESYEEELSLKQKSENSARFAALSTAEKALLIKKSLNEAFFEGAPNHSLLRIIASLLGPRESKRLTIENAVKQLRGLSIS